MYFLVNIANLMLLLQHVLGRRLEHARRLGEVEIPYHEFNTTHFLDNHRLPLNNQNVEIKFLCTSSDTPPSFVLSMATTTLFTAICEKYPNTILAYLLADSRFQEILKTSTRHILANKEFFAVFYLHIAERMCSFRPRSFEDWQQKIYELVESRVGSNNNNPILLTHLGHINKIIAHLKESFESYEDDPTVLTTINGIPILRSLLYFFVKTLVDQKIFISAKINGHKHMQSLWTLDSYFFAYFKDYKKLDKSQPFWHEIWGTMYFDAMEIASTVYGETVSNLPALATDEDAYNRAFDILLRRIQRKCPKSGVITN